MIVHNNSRSLQYVEPLYCGHHWAKKINYVFMMCPYFMFHYFCEQINL